MNSKLYLCLTLIIASFRGYYSTCSMTIEDLDKCMLQVMVFGPEAPPFPSNEDEMNKHCENMKNGVKCMRDYAANCLTGFPQQVFGMILTNMGAHTEHQCHDPKERKDFIEMTQCFQPKEKMAPVHVCVDKHIKHMELAAQLTNEEHIPGTCCGFYLFKQCFLDNTEKICSKGHSEYWQEIIDEVANEGVSFACADYDSVGKCEKLLKPELWSSLKAIQDATDPAVWHHGFKTPVKFILEMINKFHMNSK